MPRCLPFCILLILLAYSPAGNAAVYASPATATRSAEQLTRTAVEKRLGRRLSLTERVSLALVRGKAKRAERRHRQGRSNGPFDGFAVASLACGVLSLVVPYLAVPALVLGIIALGRFRRHPQFRRGKGMAIAGIVIGAAWVVLIALLVAIFAAGGFS